MNHPAKLIAVVLFAALAAPASAAVSLTLSPVPVPGQLAAHRSFDLQINTPISDWTSSALVLELAAGSIFQSPLGGDGPLSPGLYVLDPTLEFDTYVGVPGGSVAGGAGDLGGHAFEFSTTALSATFFNTAKTDIGSFPIGRVTLSDDAAGNWSLLTMTADRYRFTHTGTIANGVMEIGTETLQVLTVTGWSLVDRTDGAVLLTQNVTDAMREQAGNGFPGDKEYEYAIEFFLSNALLDEAQLQGTQGIDLLSAGRWQREYEWHTFTEAEYLESIAVIEARSAGPSLPEPGSVSLLGCSWLVILWRR